MKCRWCGRTIQRLPWKCRRCGGYFCDDHRLPEAHHCLGRGFWSETERKEMLMRNTAFSVPSYAEVAAEERRERGKGARGMAKGLFCLFFISGMVLLAIGAFHAGFGDRGRGSEGAPAWSAITTPDIPLQMVEATGLADAEGAQLEDLAASFETAPEARSFVFHDRWRKYLKITMYGGYAHYLEREEEVQLGGLLTAGDPAAKEEPTELMERRIRSMLADPYMDAYMNPLLEEIRRSSPSPDGQAKNAISLVQHIPYKKTERNITLYYGSQPVRQQNFYYPYETLYRNEGVCIDKSILLAYLLDRLGYDAVVFVFPAYGSFDEGHAAVGVRCSERYDFMDSGYAFVETTGVEIITYVPAEYEGSFQVTSYYGIVRVGNGTRSLDVSTEYRHAREWKDLMGMGTVLDPYHYHRYLALMRQYDLSYDARGEAAG
ncbi:MAG: AN1-type zinc finger domain-containing protein [Methanomicrobiales archaeon]|nr:AN1-type zinc finger domain-containing protein [Methanomicrobiales archaeon]